MRLVDTIGDYGLERGNQGSPLPPPLYINHLQPFNIKPYNFPSLLNGRRGLRGTMGSPFFVLDLIKLIGISAFIKGKH